MAMQELGQIQTFLNTANLSAHQFHIMRVSAALTVDACGAAGIGIGILQNDPTANQGASVLTARGVKTQVVLGGTVTVGATLESDVNAEAVAFTINGDGATETWCVGIALEAGDATNIVTILTVFAPASKT